jgi:hypothetical protein
MAMLCNILFEEYAAAINDMAHRIASNLNVLLDEVELVDGNEFGVLDAHMLKLRTRKGACSTIIPAITIENISKSSYSGLINKKIISALQSVR